MADTSLAQARTHARLRLLGIPLFGIGALGLLASLALWFADLAPGACVMLYIASTGLSLATFGTHNDTALAWMVRAGEEALDPGLRTELREELTVDRLAVSSLAPTPKIAWAMTLIALALHTWAAWRLAGALA